jgi:hypothetical protein
MGEEVKRVRLSVFAGLLPGFVGARREFAAFLIVGLHGK